MLPELKREERWSFIELKKHHKEHHDKEDKRLELLRKALLLLRDEIDPTVNFDKWLAHMSRIGYPEFESELAEKLGGD